jgi:hypothetical protein
MMTMMMMMMLKENAMIAALRASREWPRSQTYDEMMMRGKTMLCALS